MGSYRVEFSRSAEKDLRKIDGAKLVSIFKALDDLSNKPRPHGVKKLVGSEHSYRIRVGDYRIIYEIEDDVLVVAVIRIAHRKDVYR